MSEKFKWVTVLIPCRNEENYIGNCLDSLIANDYPKELLNILVIDGMSTDKTREVVNEYCNKYSFIKIIDNQRIIKPAALNLGIKLATADVIMRIDAHATYPKEYISKLVLGLFLRNADNIGGVRDTSCGDTLLSGAIAIGISHPFSVGNAYWRTGSRDVRVVDTVFCGCYKKEVFEKIGFFNEKLIRTQDREFNDRLVQAGGVIILDPSVNCTYYPRTKLIDYVKWNFLGAYWIFYAKRFTKTKMTAWRNYVPMAFVLYHLNLFILLFKPAYSVEISIIIPIVMYFTIVFCISLQLSFKNKKVSYIILLPLIFAITHYSYGIGSIFGLLKARLLGKDLPL